MGDIAGLGEIGLDYSKKNNIPHDVQQQVFRAQLGLALKLRKPICLHIREANDDGLRILKQVWLRHICIPDFPSYSDTGYRDTVTVLTYPKWPFIYQT